MYISIVKLKDGREFRLKSDTEIVSKLKNAFRDRVEKPDVEVVGKNTTVKAGEIVEIYDVFQVIHQEQKEEEKIWYKVMHGYGDNDFISIPKDEVIKAKYKQALGGDEIYSYGGYSIQAKTILKIIPDTNKILGYYPDYKPKGAELIEAGKLEREHSIYLKDAEETILYALKNNYQHLLDQPNTSLTEIQEKSGYRYLLERS